MNGYIFNINNKLRRGELSRSEQLNSDNIR